MKLFSQYLLLFLCILGVNFASAQVDYILGTSAIDETLSNMPVDVAAKQLEAAKTLQIEEKREYKIELAETLETEATAHTLDVTMTAYSSTVDQTDDTPFITSTQQPVRIGIVAVSRDLLSEELPYGTTLRVVEAHGEADRCGAWDVNMILEVQDTMHRRKQQQIDLWLPSREAALRWGYCQATVEILEPAATTQPHWWSDLQQNHFVSLGITLGLLGQVFDNPTNSSHLPHLLSIFGMIFPHVKTPSPIVY